MIRHQKQLPQNEVPPKPKEPAPFDRKAFASKLRFIDEEEALGFSQDDGMQLGIGYCAMGSMRDRVCFPLRNAEGSIAGYVGYNANAEPVLKLPPKWWQTATTL